MRTAVDEEGRLGTRGGVCKYVQHNSIPHPERKHSRPPGADDNMEEDVHVAGKTAGQPKDANGECPMEWDDSWLPACTHMSDNENQNVTRREGFVQKLSDVESVPDFLGDVKVHVWVDGSEICGHIGFGVYFPHGEFPNVSQPVLGTQAKNRAKISVVRAATGVTAPRAVSR